MFLSKTYYPKIASAALASALFSNVQAVETTAAKYGIDTIDAMHQSHAKIRAEYPRAKIEAISYTLEEDQVAHYPTINECIENAPVEDLSAIALNEFGVSVLKNGIKALNLYNEDERNLLMANAQKPALVALVSKQDGKWVKTHNCHNQVGKPSPSAITGLSYTLKLPNGKRMYPSMNFCLYGSSFKDTALISKNDIGSAIIAAGLEAMGMPVQDNIINTWNTPPHKTSTRLPTGIVVRSPNDSGAPDVIAFCADANGGHLNKDDIDIIGASNL